MFKTFDTSNFEEIIKKLDDSAHVVAEYGVPDDICKRLRADAEQLKQWLVDVITNNHPEKSTSIPESAYRSCINFLKHFSRIYTLNYDLLLYWTVIKYMEWGDDYAADSTIKLLPKKIEDGFSGTDTLLYKHIVINY